MSRLLLIDGHSILFRAFYGMPLAMTAPDGRHTNAVYGFLAIVGKVVEEEKPDFLAVAFDLAAPTFRHRLYPEYKGNRAPAPEEFHEQVPVMKQLLADMGIPVVTCEGWEADDILGTLASKAEKDGTEVTILSGDRDLLQLADDHTRIVIPKTKGGQTAYERYTPAEVQAAFGVSPEDFIQLKALMGDSSDNVPGLPGVGPKTALKIMQTFGSIESAHEHVGEIRPKKAMEAMRDHYDDLMLSLDLVTIRRNAPVEYDRKTFAFGSPWTEAALRDCRELGFRSIVSRYEDSGKKPEPQPDDFRRITELAAFEETLRAAAAAPAAGVSAETAGGRLFAAAVAFGDETAVVAPGGFLTQEVIRDGFRRLLHKRTAETACMHAKELIRFCGFTDASRLFDCVIASYLLDPLKSDWDYEAIAQGALGRSVPSEDDLLGKKGLAGLNGMTDEEAEEKAVLLAGYEASVALQAEKPLEEKLKETGMLALFESVEMPLTAVLASMEEAGIRASREALARYGNELDAHIKELTGRIFAEAGEEFNLNSPKQLLSSWARFCSERSAFPAAGRQRPATRRRRAFLRSCRTITRSRRTSWITAPTRSSNPPMRTAFRPSSDRTAEFTLHSIRRSRPQDVYPARTRTSRTSRCGRSWAGGSGSASVRRREMSSSMRTTHRLSFGSSPICPETRN